MNSKRKCILGLLITVLSLCFVPHTVQAASKSASFKTITSKWKKIHGDYYKKESGKILYKDEKNSAVREVYYGEMTTCYTNGYYIYAYYYSGANDHQILRFRRATKVEKISTGKVFAREYEQDRVYSGLWGTSGGNAWVSLEGASIPFLGRNGNCIWMLGGEATEYGQKNYVYSFNMKTGKCKKIWFNMSDSFGFITVTKKYLYGTTECQGLPQQIAVIDRKTGKSWKTKKEVVDYKFKNNKIYGIQEKYSEDGRTRYFREITMNGQGKKILKVGKWSTNYPW